MKCFMGKMFEKTSEFDFSHDIRLLAQKKQQKKSKNIKQERQLKASIKATCAALSKTSTYFEPFPSLWGDFFLFISEKKKNRK